MVVVGWGLFVRWEHLGFGPSAVLLPRDLLSSLSLSGSGWVLEFCLDRIERGRNALSLWAFLGANDEIADLQSGQWMFLLDTSGTTVQKLSQ